MPSLWTNNSIDREGLQSVCLLLSKICHAALKKDYGRLRLWTEYAVYAECRIT